MISTLPSDQGAPVFREGIVRSVIQPPEKLHLQFLVAGRLSGSSRDAFVDCAKKKELLWIEEWNQRFSAYNHFG
jgi:hypothetical protein